MKVEGIKFYILVKYKRQRNCFICLFLASFAVTTQKNVARCKVINYRVSRLFASFFLSSQKHWFKRRRARPGRLMKIVPCEVDPSALVWVNGDCAVAKELRKVEMSSSVSGAAAAGRARNRVKAARWKCFMGSM